MKKEARALIREAERQGWTLEYGGKHPRLVSPSGAKVPFSAHAKGAYVQTIRRMERLGFRWPKKGRQV